MVPIGEAHHLQVLPDGQASGSTGQHRAAHAPHHNIVVLAHQQGVQHDPQAAVQYPAAASKGAADCQQSR